MSATVERELITIAGPCPVSANWQHISSTWTPGGLVAVYSRPVRPVPAELLQTDAKGEA
ncbi:MAG TPA: hypothetical protein VI337_01475 [Nitrospirales bacterium]|nr:hypothetical protein [Nitrospirales bacterium]